MGTRTNGARGGWIAAFVGALMIQPRLEAEVVSKVSDVNGRVLPWSSASTRAAFACLRQASFEPLATWIARYAVR